MMENKFSLIAESELHVPGELTHFIQTYGLTHTPAGWIRFTVIGDARLNEVKRRALIKKAAPNMVADQEVKLSELIKEHSK